MYIARARRSLCIIDTGSPRNRFAAHSHGFFTQDGSAPGTMLATARSRGGAIGATLEAFALPLGSTDMLSNALILAAFDRAPPTPPECPIPAEPPPRPHEAAGKAKSTKRTATFT